MKYILSTLLLIYSKNAFAIPVEFIAAKTVGIVVLALIFIGVPFLIITLKERSEDKKIKEINLKKYGKEEITSDDINQKGKDYFDKAKEYFDRKDYNKANDYLDDCLQLIEDKDAFFLKGQLLKKGLGVTKNHDKARNLFIKSYNAGKSLSLIEYIQILDKNVVDNIKLSIDESNPLRNVSYFTKTEIYLSQVIWLKSGLEFFAQQLISFYNLRKEKNKDSAIVDFTYIYNPCKNSVAKSKLLLLFYNYNFTNTKSTFLKDKKMRDYYYSSFTFLNSTNDIDEKNLRDIFTNELFENPFLEFLDLVPSYSNKTIWDKIYQSDTDGWNKLFNDLAYSKLYKGKEF